MRSPLILTEKKHLIDYETKRITLGRHFSNRYGRN